MSLPKLVINSEFKDNCNLLSIIRGIAINNSKEFFFRKLPSIYETSDFEVINKLFMKDINILEQMSFEIEQRIESEIKEILHLSDKPFEEALFEWSKKAKDTKNGEDYNKHLFEWLVINAEMPITNKQSFLKFFSEKIQGFNYYNWISEDNFIEFREKLIEIINENKITLTKKITNSNMSTLEKLLKTKLYQDIENIGTSLSQEEILKVIELLYSEIALNNKN